MKRVKYPNKEQDSYIEILPASEFDAHVSDNEKHWEAGEKDTFNNKVQELTQSIADEKLARVQKDQELEAEIEQEAQERNKLQSTVNAHLVDEEKHWRDGERKELETNLQSLHNKDEALDTQIKSIEKAYKDADTQLGNRIDGVEAAYKEADNEIKASVKKVADSLQVHIFDDNIHVSIDEKNRWNKASNDLISHLKDREVHFDNQEQKTSILNHITDTGIHIDPADKDKWNSHIKDNSIHISPDDRAKWDRYEQDIEAERRAREQADITLGQRIETEAQERRAKHDELNQAITEHKNDTDKHLQAGERDKWNGYKGTIDVIHNNQNQLNDLYRELKFFNDTYVNGDFMGVYADEAYKTYADSQLKENDWVLRVRGNETLGMAIYRKSLKDWEIRNFNIPYSGNGGIFRGIYPHNTHQSISTTGFNNGDFIFTTDSGKIKYACVWDSAGSHWNVYQLYDGGDTSSTTNILIKKTLYARLKSGARGLGITHPDAANNKDNEHMLKINISSIGLVLYLFMFKQRLCITANKKATFAQLFRQYAYRHPSSSTAVKELQNGSYGMPGNYHSDCANNIIGPCIPDFENIILKLNDSDWGGYVDSNKNIAVITYGGAGSGTGSSSNHYGVLHGSRGTFDGLVLYGPNYEPKAPSSNFAPITEDMLSQQEDFYYIRLSGGFDRATVYGNQDLLNLYLDIEVSKPIKTAHTVMPSNKTIIREVTI